MRALKKLLFLFLVSFVGVIAFASTASASTEYKEMDKKTNVDQHYDFTVKFSQEIDKSSVNVNTIYVLSNSTILDDVTVSLNPDKKSVKVTAPSKGYIFGADYELIVSSEVTSFYGKSLVQPVKMPFKIKESNQLQPFPHAGGILPAEIGWNSTDEEVHARMSEISKICEFEKGFETYYSQCMVNVGYEEVEVTIKYDFTDSTISEVDIEFNQRSYTLGESRKIYDEYTKIFTKELGTPFESEDDLDYMGKTYLSTVWNIGEGSEVRSVLWNPRFLDGYWVTISAYKQD